MILIALRSITYRYVKQVHRGISDCDIGMFSILVFHVPFIIKLFFAPAINLYMCC